MNRKKIVIYVIIPVALTLTLILAYFSGISWLQHIVSPEISWLQRNSMRELGLLENLQNILLLAIIVILCMAVRKKPHILKKLAAAFLAAGFTLLFLEEIDYGLTFRDFFMHIPWAESEHVRNLHNQGDRTDILKKTLDLGIALYFVLFPLIFAKSKNRFIRYIVPDRHIVLTVISMLILRELAHGLKDAGYGAGGTMQKNLSEFRELMVYYTFMIYIIDMAFLRKLSTGSDGKIQQENP